MPPAYQAIKKTQNGSSGALPSARYMTHPSMPQRLQNVIKYIGGHAGH